MKVYIILSQIDDGSTIHSVYLNEDDAKYEMERLNKAVQQVDYYYYEAFDVIE